MRRLNRLMHGLKMVVLFAVGVTLLSGCMYHGDDASVDSKVAAKEYMVVVQNAVDEYHKATGVLPIKNSDMETPIYEKYMIDFGLLKSRNFISDIPKNAYEKGGNAYYVIVDAETAPKVKLMDLLAKTKVMDVQAKVDAYHDASGTYPTGEKVADGFYLLDFDKLGIERVQIPSAYSRTFLPLLLRSNGEVVIDYAPEIVKSMELAKITSPMPALDLRTILVDQGYYVPVCSYPYYWRNGQPQIYVR